MKYRVLLTAHHVLDPDSGVGQITSSLKESYEDSGKFEVTLLDHSILKFAPYRLRFLLFPIVVLFKVVESILKHRPFDLVHSTTGDGALLAILKSNKPLVLVQSHGIEQLVDDQLAKAGVVFSFRQLIFRNIVVYPLVSWSLRSAEAVFVLSPYEESYVNKNFNCRTFLVLNSHNLKKPEKLVSNTNQTIVMMRSKTSQLAILAFEEVKQKFPNLDLLLLGPGTSTELNFKSDAIQVIEHYSNSELSNLLSGCSIHVSVSKKEGFPLFLMECVSQGLVPVLSKIPAHTWFFEMSPLCYLVEDSLESLVVGIERAINANIDDRQRMVNWAEGRNRKSQMEMQLECVLALLSQHSKPL